MLNPLRSILFTPGDSGRKLQKAARSGADAVVIDLEDAVAPSALADAHQLTLNALQTIDFGRSKRLVRINGHSQDALLADIEAILPGKPDGVVVPKVESAEMLTLVAQKLPENVSIFALIETAAGFMNLPDIMKGDAKLEGLILGGEDLIASIGAKPTPGRKELAYARGALVMAASAYQLQAIDTVFTAWRDVEGLTQDAQIAAEVGFTGKLAIHPAQLPAIHEAFSPTAAEIEWANDVILESQRLKEQGIGVFSFGGRMIDEAHIRIAKRILALNSTNN
ncbi:MAG: citrate lyase beta subunit [Cellvibrionaceae bacterium]|jgi:citrate lyase beta subunit